ncbi:MAG: ankyrin repeat domain-containing protein, partial [Alistipes sp.]|nr:ankyrin repeat domain-containing protein [Alistipes sp.]
MAVIHSDMTKYCYQHFENAYNIGWKIGQKETAENKNTFDPAFLEKLCRYCDNPLNRDLNGVHRRTEIGGKSYVKGFGEIRVIDFKQKIRYAAPNVIVDDISDGKYTPPAGFIEAVMSAPELSSAEYRKFYAEYSEENFWGEPMERCLNIEKALFLLEKDWEGFKEYVAEDNRINMVTLRGSLLNYAIETDREREALWLIENGMDINAFDGLELLTAIKKGSNDVAKELIDRKIAVDADLIQDNPLVSAIRFSNLELVEQLMKNYRNLIVTYSNEYVRDCTILDIARRTR